MLSRRPDDVYRETKNDIHKVNRNFDPEMHPFEANREYVRAMNAAKLERVFAKPFLGALDPGHGDVVSACVAHPTRTSRAASASADGEVKVWDLQRKTCVKTFSGGHGGRYVRGIAFNPSGSRLVSVGDDKQIVTWDVTEDSNNSAAAVQTVASKQIVNGVTFHRSSETFATCGEGSTLLWDSGRTFPIKELSWGVDSVHAVKFNQIETDILAAAASDRSVILFDVRAKTPAVRKIVMDLKTNAIAWNPMEAFVFATASEDYNVYAFDSRQLKRPVNVHVDHVGAVTSLDYAPTGREIVTGSYDKTVRIFSVDEGHSREVYHTKRMQRLTCVAWSRDNRYILSGSDEMNLRLWKARAWEKMGIMKDRQKSSIEYSEKLKEKYASHPQVKRVMKRRHVPKHVLNAGKEHHIIKDSRKRKEANRRANSKPGSVPYVGERDKHVLTEHE